MKNLGVEHDTTLRKMKSTMFRVLKYATSSLQERSDLHPGECWCMPGDGGRLIISLSHPVSISDMTLGHITKSQSPNGLITSAPRKFSIYVSVTFFRLGEDYFHCTE